MLVVGDHTFCQTIRPAAARARRTVVGRLDVDQGTDEGPGEWDELVLDAALFDRFRLTHPALLARADRVWVLPASSAGGKGDVFAHPLPLLGRVAKRTLDIAVSAAALLLVLPVLLLAMVAVRVDSAGPAIFRQVRVGANGRKFRLFKIRTMFTGNDDSGHRAYVAGLISGNAERHGGVFKLVGDARITSIGRFLRRFSIDELPQLWNVLKGDMSIVGPRPPLPGEVELYGDGAWGRLRVKPGITGLWQVSGRSELSFHEMVALDVEYWQRWSLLLDLKILVRTPAVVFAATGA